MARSIQVGVSALVVIYALVLVVPVIVTRFTFPLSLEHLEGSLSAITWKWIHGESLYPTPTMESAGTIYTPGYFILSRGWVAVFGHTLPALRGLTLVLLLLTAGTAAYVIRQLGGTRTAIVLWIPLYLLLFDYYGWVDNANKDTMHLFLAMAGLALVSSSMNPNARFVIGRCVLAGLVWACAFMTKQSHVILLFPVFAFLFFSGRRQMWAAGVSLTVFTCAMMGAAYLVWGESFWRWVYLVPKGHALRPDQFLHITQTFTAAGVGFFVVGISYAWWAVRQRGLAFPTLGQLLRGRWPEGENRIAGLVVSFAVGALLIGVMSAIKDRGGNYAFLQTVAVLSIFVALALTTRRYTRAVCALVLLLFPMTNPLDRAVTASDRDAADHLIATLREEPGDVWVPAHSWIPIAAGKKSYVAMNGR